MKIEIPFFGLLVKSDIELAEKPSIRLSKYMEVQKKIINTVIEKSKEGRTYNFSRIQEHLFNTDYKPDVFISHSYQNKDTAIALANRLHQKEFTTFLDHVCWESIYELEERLINDECKSQGKCDCGERRNIIYSDELIKVIRCTTAILTKALNQVISQSSCVLFLDTEDFLQKRNSSGAVIDSSITKSPWIYSEIEHFNSLVMFYKRYVDPMRKSMLGESENYSRMKDSFSAKFWTRPNCNEIDISDFMEILDKKKSLEIYDLYQISENPTFDKDFYGVVGGPF